MVQKGPFWYGSETGYRAHRRAFSTEVINGFAQHKGGQAPTHRPPSLVLFDMRLGEGLSRLLAHRV